MGKPDLPLSSSQPDPRVLYLLGRLQFVLLILVAAIAGSIFAAWCIPPLGRLLPAGWDLMKANTSILCLASTFSLVLWQPRRSSRALFVARLLALGVTLLAAATLVEYLAHLSPHIDTAVAADRTSPLPGRLSLQTAWSFLLIGFILANLRARKRTFANLVDSLTFALTLLVLIFLSGYFFGALHLYGVSLATRLAPQTLVCVCLLTFVIVNRRAEYGILSIMLSGSIGGKTARTAAPWALCLPFLLTLFRGLILRFTDIPSEYVLALTASIMSVFGFCLILMLSRRINHLENAIRDLSLRDELTSLYNRRGFYFLAAQSLRLARRADGAFFVLFVDMDHLKLLNDTHGHDVGSEQLKRLGQLLDRTFRETDVVARLGGDEFVVAGRADEPALSIALARLRRAAVQLAADSTTPQPLEFSLGYVVSEPDSRASLDELVERADAVMYEAKRQKKLAASTATAAVSIS
jgi:diguanylate cyclase (GGDEF)-like protein